MFLKIYTFAFYVIEKGGEKGIKIKQKPFTKQTLSSVSLTQTTRRQPPKNESLDKNSIAKLYNGEYGIDAIIDGIGDLDTNRQYNRDNLLDYTRKRYRHSIYICILAFISCGLYLLTTDIDQPITAEHFSIWIIILFIFSKILITFCVLFTITTLGVKNYIYIGITLFFPALISINIIFRKQTYASVLFYNISFLKMFLAGLMLYLSICNYQYSQNYFKKKISIKWVNAKHNLITYGDFGKYFTQLLSLCDQMISVFFTKLKNTTLCFIL